VPKIIYLISQFGIFKDASFLRHSVSVVWYVGKCWQWNVWTTQINWSLFAL